MQDVIDGQIVLLLKAGVRNSGMTVNCLSGLGNRAKKFIRSSNPAMPSNSPRITIVGTVMAAGSTTGNFEHMSMYVPFGIDESSARIASANASMTRLSAHSG